MPKPAKDIHAHSRGGCRWTYLMNILLISSLALLLTPKLDMSPYSFLYLLQSPKDVAMSSKNLQV